MKNKYFILAFTFLCLLLGQNSYSQDWADLENLFQQDEYQDIEISYYGDYNDYIYDTNHDNDYSNDFVDLNNDGFINEYDNIATQIKANAWDLPVTMTDAEINAILQNAVQLSEVVVTKSTNSNLFTTDQEDICIYYPVYCDLQTDPNINDTNIIIYEDSGTNTSGLNISHAHSLGVRYSALIDLYLSKYVGNDTVKMMLVSLSVSQAFLGILINSDGNCGNTVGGCQSWFYSNYIGASSSEDKAEVQRANGVEPIDAVDLAAYNHDVDYDNIPAAGVSDALFNLATLQADRDLVAACHNVINMYLSGTNDPITGSPVSEVTRDRAIVVIAAFEMIINAKREFE